MSPASGACAMLLLLLGACVGPAPTPATAPPIIRPLPTPPPPRPPAITDWHDMPATPGTWQWHREGDLSVSRFSNPLQFMLLSMTCNPLAHTVTITPTEHPGVPASITIYTTTLTRVLPIQPTAEGGIAATIAGNDPLLDAMAFSRGRFAVKVPGLAALYLPSWPEVGRVIEDCR